MCLGFHYRSLRDQFVNKDLEQIWICYFMEDFETIEHVRCNYSALRRSKLWTLGFFESLNSLSREYISTLHMLRASTSRLQSYFLVCLISIFYLRFLYPAFPISFAFRISLSPLSFPSLLERIKNGLFDLWVLYLSLFSNLTKPTTEIKTNNLKIFNV